MVWMEVVSVEYYELVLMKEVVEEGAWTLMFLMMMTTRVQKEVLCKEEELVKTVTDWIVKHGEGWRRRSCAETRCHVVTQSW